MTQAATLSTHPRRVSDFWVIGGVSAAHFVSHYYILLLPPLFYFVRAEYDVSYTQLGLALSVFNLFTATLQTPAGFLVDRVSARLVLIGGLALGGCAFAVVGLVDSFWMLVAMFAVAGIGNAVYHPADYSILSHQVAPERIGQAFSIHTFAGMLGSAAAPASLVVLAGLVGWRGAFLAAAALGVTLAVALAFQPDVTRLAKAAEKNHAGDREKTQLTGWRLLFSAPIIRNLIFFVLFAVAMAGIQGYSVVALAALHDTPVALGNSALSGFLLMSALGVLSGGVIVGRTSRHGVVATIGLIVMALVATLIGLAELSAPLLIAVLSLGGFFFGAIMPSRDLIVREVTPAGSFGKVFGFVTTGFNIGGIISPLVFGAVMDHGSPRAVFFIVSACCLLSIVTLTARRRAGQAA
jgi:MFS family permease